jgi:hypothetical protein
MIAHIFRQLKDDPDINVPKLRHTVLNAIRSIALTGDGSQLVLASDSTNYWRKTIFPHYKARRKENAEKSGRDLTIVYETINLIRDEIREIFHFPVLHIEECEADDIIAVLTEKYHEREPIRIISADHDFIQLQDYPGVTQWNPIHKCEVKHDDPSSYLIEHILRGDTGDGIPNVLSPADCFVTHTRQTSLTSKRLAELSKFGDDITEEIITRIELNSELIDFSHIPAYIKLKIHKEFEAQQGKPRDKILPYMMKHKLRNLMGAINDFG